MLELKASESKEVGAQDLSEECLRLQSTLSQPQSLLVFTARSYGDFSSLALEPWAGELGVGLGPLPPQVRPPQARYLF